MGKFKPVKFGITILVISLAILIGLSIQTLDLGVALQIPAPELRVVGGCFRDCLDPEQTGFRILNGETTVTTTTGETITLSEGGIIIVEDPTTGEITTLDASTGEELFLEPAIVDSTIEIAGQLFEAVNLKDGIACWLNVQANILDNNGNVIGTEASTFFRLNPVPQLSLTDVPTGKSIDEQGGFDIFPMIKCSTSTTGGGLDPEDPLFTFFPPFIYPSFDTPLKLEPTQLVVRVYSQNADASALVDTFNFPITIDALDITDATSRELGNLKVPSERILVFLPDGMYNSVQHIVLEGNLILHWNTGVQEVDAIPFLIKLETKQIFNAEGNRIAVSNPVTIFREIAVEKNVGEEPPEPIECKSGQVVVGNQCIPVVPMLCPEPTVLVEGSCQFLPTEPPVIPTGTIIDRFIICIQSGSQDCFLSTEFFPFYLLGVAFTVLIIGVAQRKQPDIYGVPRGGF